MPERFIADAMLGRLARWLRLLGHDTIFHPDISDRDLLGIARREGRFILTRDTHFPRKDIEDCLYIESDDVQKQIAQVITDLHPRPGEGRCANCNGLLEDVKDRKTVEAIAPEHVYRSFTRFRQCSLCGNLYWEGSQWKKFRAVADEVKKGFHGAGH